MSAIKRSCTRCDDVSLIERCAGRRVRVREGESRKKNETENGWMCSRGRERGTFFWFKDEG